MASFTRFTILAASLASGRSISISFCSWTSVAASAIRCSNARHHMPSLGEEKVRHVAADTFVRLVLWHQGHELTSCLVLGRTNSSVPTCAVDHSGLDLEHVSLASDHFIEHGVNEKSDEEAGDESSEDENSEGPLRVGPHAGGKRGRGQAPGCDPRRHHCRGDAAPVSFPQ